MGIPKILTIFLLVQVITGSIKNRTTVNAEYNREKAEGVTTVERALGGIKYDQFFSKKWYAYE